MSESTTKPNPSIENVLECLIRWGSEQDARNTQVRIEQEKAQLELVYKVFKQLESIGVKFNPVADLSEDQATIHLEKKPCRYNILQVVIFKADVIRLYIGDDYDDGVFQGILLDWNEATLNILPTLLDNLSE